jgi:hypothetical protein
MHKVKSTYKVLGEKALQQDSAEGWIDWALEMMEAGYESEHLFMLAGLSTSLNRFEFDDVVNRTLKELSLDKYTEEEKIRGYVYYYASEALNGKMSTKAVLNKLRIACQSRDYDQILYPFYLLAYAQEEQEEFGVQFYWQEAGSDELDSVINNQFQKWISSYEGNNPKCA